MVTLNKDEIIRRSVGLWSEKSDIKLPDALALMIANTSADKSPGQIDAFIGNLLSAVSNLEDSEFETIFGGPRTSVEVDRTLVESVRELTTEKAARRNETKFSDRLAENQVTVSSQEGLVFRFGHLSFWANENGTEENPYVVPSSLSIRRSHLTKKIETVRSSSSPVAIAPDPVEAISVDLVFPSVSCFNQKFRELYSMTQMLPVFTIDSPLITKAFINETDFPEIYNRAIGEMIASDQKAAKNLKGVQQEALQSIENAVELARTDDPFVDNIIDRISFEVENDILQSDDSQLPDADTVTNKVSTAVGVALRSITAQSLAGQPGAVMVRLSFTRASIPMLEKVQPVYLDANGRPTHSVDNAHWLKKFSRTLMNENIAGSRYLEPIDVNKPDWDEFSLTWENIFGQEKTAQLNTSVSTETQFSLASGFKIAPLNIVNSSSPLVQHMGRNNLEAIVVIETMDKEFVAQLSQAKSEIKEEAKNGYIRRNSAAITHPVINLMGVQRVSIRDIAIQEDQETPGLINITLTLIENALNIEDVESLTLEEGGFDIKAAKILWEFARELTKYQHGLKMEDSNLRGRLDDAEAHTVEFIERMLWGASRNSPGIMRMPKSTDHGASKFAAVRAGILRLYKRVARKNKVNNINAHIDSIKPAIEKVAGLATGWTFDPEPRIKSTDEHGRIYEALGYVVEKELVSGGTANFGGGGLVPETTISSVDTYKYVVKSQPFPDALWDAIFDEILRAKSDRRPNQLWESRDLKAILAVLSGVVESGALDKFVSIPKFDFTLSGAMDPGKIIWRYRDYLKEKESPENIAARNKAATNYADMVLPTYDELFGGARDSEGELIWKKFAPTYSDLGIRPPVNEQTTFMNVTDAFNLCAHTEFDLVSPGAFFYKPRVKKFMHDIAQEVHEENYDQSNYYEVIQVSQNYGDVLKNLNADNFSEVRESQLQSFVLGLIARDKEVDPNTGEQRSNSQKFEDYKNDSEQKIVEVVSSEGQPIMTFTKDANGRPQGIVSVGKRHIFTSRPEDPALNPQSRADTNKLLYSSIEHTPDNISNADKSFPAVRVYLVEEDRRYRSLFDDLYAVSAIQSVSVTRDHMDADTAVLKLANTSGYLSEDSFIPKFVDDRVDDDGEPFLSKFKVTYGTHIVVKMGYASRPEDLKTVFTGAVAEIMGGESITIIAQSFQTELLNEVGLFQEYFNWDQADRPHLRNVINKVLGSNGEAPHLGRVIKEDYPHSKEAGETLKQLYGTYSGVDTIAYRTPLRYIAESLFGKEFSDIGRNIYMDSNTTFGWEFVVPTMPTMSAIRECTRYQPNFIADVVPYGVDGTLYIGDPAGHYKYREITPREKQLGDIAAHEEAIDLFTLGGAFGKVVSGFLNSPEFKNYEATLVRINDLSHGDNMRYGGFEHSWGLTTWYGRDMDKVTDYERPIIDEVKSLESSINGLHRRAFSLFFGLSPNVTQWPRGFQAGWRDMSEALLSPWYNASEDGPTAKYWDSVSYLKGNLLDSKRTKQVLAANEISFSKDIKGWFKNSLKTKNNLMYKYKTIWGLADENEYGIENFANAPKRLPQDAEDRTISGSGMESVRNGDVSEGTLITDHVYNHAIRYRAFMLHFVEYLQKNKIADTSEAQKARVFGAEMPPGYKTFRDYHLITSEQDIIENNIVASDSEMWTAAVLKAPGVVKAEGFWSSLTNIVQASSGIDDPTVEGNMVTLSPDQDYVLWPAEKNIPGEGNRAGMTFRGESPTAEDILKFFLEPNAVTPFAASIALNSRLCEGMEKMYRGNIVIAGKAIKPHDVIHIRDAKTSIMGNFVAERVTHNFDPNFGWTTTIVPKAATFHNASYAYEGTSFWADLWNVVTSDEVNNVLLYLSIAAVVASIATTGGLSTAVVGPFLANLTRQAGMKATRTAIRLGGKNVVRAGGKLRTALGNSPAGTFANYLGNSTGRLGAAYLAQTTLQAGDRSVGSTLRAMTDAAIQQKIGGDKYPVLVNTLVYNGRPYTAGFKPNEFDFNTEFWKNFSAMMGDLGEGIGDLFESNKKTDVDARIRDIVGE